jgi:hypothetical protein
MNTTGKIKTISVSGLPRGYKEPLAMTATTTANGNDKKVNINIQKRRSSHCVPLWGTALSRKGGGKDTTTANRKTA